MCCRLWALLHTIHSVWIGASDKDVYMSSKQSLSSPSPTPSWPLKCNIICSQILAGKNEGGFGMGEKDIATGSPVEA